MFDVPFNKRLQITYKTSNYKKYITVCTKAYLYLLSCRDFENSNITQNNHSRSFKVICF